MKLLIIGGSDAGISAGLAAREVDHKAYYPVHIDSDPHHQ
jgi:hypothetical protein